jgi:ubiquitin C-terminal hydrolase
MKVLDYDSATQRDLLFLLDHLSSKDLEIEQLRIKLKESKHESEKTREKYLALLEKLA